jgi:hypothetical protein
MRLVVMLCNLVQQTHVLERLSGSLGESVHEWILLREQHHKVLLRDGHLAFVAHIWYKSGDTFVTNTILASTVFGRVLGKHAQASVDNL